MRKTMPLFLTVIMLFLMLSCSAPWSSSGRTQVLTPLKSPIDSSESCLVGDIEPPKNLFQLPRSWDNILRGRLAESLKSKQIFASVKSLPEDTARYWVTGKLLDLDWLTWTEQVELRGNDKHRRTYDRQVQAPVAIAEFTLRDMQNGQVIFSMRIKSKGMKNDQAGTVFSGCACQFAASLDEAVKKSRK